MIHIGRPGEDGFTERVLASWGVDGHNSHTNVCSSGGRAGFQFWMGIDRPSPDYANAKVIYPISAHLETGHYFNPHAQRITEARANGAKVIVLDTRLSNTAIHADHWLSPQPGSEAAINLAVANHLIQTGRHGAGFVRRWWNWQEYMTECHPGSEATFEAFQEILAGLYADFTFEFAAAESGISEAALREMAETVAGAGSRFACHSWRSAAAGNLGGWQVSRTLFLISALLGAVASEGGTFLNAWNKFMPRPIHVPPHPGVWQELSWPVEYPLAQNELSFLLPPFPQGRPREAGHLLHPRLQPGVDLPGRFSNPRPALRALISRVLRGPEGRGPRARQPERHDTRGSVVRKSVKSQTRLSPAKRAELIADYVAGVPVEAIASKFRVHRAAVPELARRAGVPIREAGLPSWERGQAASLYEAGMTLAQVAERMSIDVDTVRAAVLAQGAQIRPRGRRPRKHPH